MEQIKNLMIAALNAGNIKEVKRLKPEFEAEKNRNAWLDKFKNNVPISEWIKEENPFITFK